MITTNNLKILRGLPHFFIPNSIVVKQEEEEAIITATATATATTTVLFF